jgi:hypothetical protein
MNDTMIESNDQEYSGNGKQYMTPRLTKLGRVSELTKGTGSTEDDTDFTPLGEALPP